MSACLDCLTQSFDNPNLYDSDVRSVDAALEVVRAAQGEHDDLWTVCVHDAEYPERLRETADAPPVLYGCGSLELFAELTDNNGVAFVGARRASAYGREVAYSYANEVADADLIVISGMALGIDGAAHRGALQANGRTIAVLAGSPLEAYPRSHKLLHEQIRDRGCVISECPPGQMAHAQEFAARQRIVGTLAAMTVFVEGSTESGAMHAVNAAHGAGCKVAAVPGPVTSHMSFGPNELLSGGVAQLVTDPEDIFTALQVTRDEPRVTRELAEPERAVLLDIRNGIQIPRALAEANPQLDARTISRALGVLELKGLVTRTPTGAYVLIPQVSPPSDDA